MVQAACISKCSKVHKFGSIGRPKGAADRPTRDRRQDRSAGRWRLAATGPTLHPRNAPPAHEGALMATTPIVEPLRIRDAIALPDAGATVTATAQRSDTYEVHVVAGMGPLLERLGALLDGVSVAVITDETVRELYGAALVRDPYEADLRRPLNFGHTIGHPLETVTGYGPLLHGEAVAFGMVVESRIAAARGLLDEDALERIVELLRRCGLPTTAADLRAPVQADAILAAMEKVRLIRAGSLRFVLPIAPGETVIADDVTEDEVRSALHAAGVSD